MRFFAMWRSGGWKLRQCYNQIDTVVQPDVAIICDRHKLDDKGCRGAPDWVIEVLSPATAYRDLEVKRRLYELDFGQTFFIENFPKAWYHTVFLTINNGGRQ